MRFEHAVRSVLYVSVCVGMRARMLHAACSRRFPPFLMPLPLFLTANDRAAMAGAGVAEPQRSAA